MSQRPERPDVPTRVRVTGPPRRHPARPRTSGRDDVDQQTPLGGMYVRALLREQLLLAGRVLLVLALTVGALPLLFFVVPGLADVDVAGVPVGWLLPGVLVYPWLVLLGWRYVRAAERNERAFAALLQDED